jgi:hypothetical protein
MKAGLVISCLLAALAPSAPAAAFSGKFKVAHDALNHELNRLCPRKHLDLLGPIQVEDDADDFLQAMPRADRRRVQRITGQDDHHGPAACSEFDPGCSSLLTVYGFRAVGRLTPFARHLCASYKRCTGWATCESVR